MRKERGIHGNRLVRAVPLEFSARMKSHEIQPQKCPFCGYTCTHSTGIAQDEAWSPEPGSRSICIKCRKVSVYGDNLLLRKPTESEHAENAVDERIIKAQIVMAGFRK